MQRALGDEGIVVLLAEVARLVEGAGNDADSLELGAGVANRLLVDGESLRKKLVADLLEAVLVGDLTTCNELA